MLDLDEIALLAEMCHVLGQHELHAAMFALENLITLS